MPEKLKHEDRAIRKIRTERGLSVKVAKACGIERAAVYQWKKVPATQVHTVAAVLDWTPEQIRPDIFKPKPRKRKA